MREDRAPPRAIAIAIAIALRGLAAFGVGCHAFYVVSGRVVDCSDQAPVDGADLHLELARLQEKGRATSDPSGSFHVVLNAPPGEEASELVVEKPGYAPLHATVKNPEVPQQLCLQRLRP
ncbi:carboxypeptidase-like regulatory domain-containing protein [Sorangium sp. So ce131]|uniref:carboxypeptidase-like regulatory domain-containing protein n=1 Tax=Sorangium sp. So ce131 TaxID=3133282 RepID=UPI003F642B4D